MVDLLLKGGEVIDPARNIRAKLDVAITHGAIAQVASNIAPSASSRVIDVSGKLVVPGLIDLHCHIYEGVNQNGVNPDLAGVKSGVTTLVDAGSAGCYTFGGFPQHITPQAKTRILCMLHISKTGLSYQPDLSRREDIDLEETVRVIGANKPLIQGVKLRAVGPAVPTMGIEMVRLAKKAATEGGVRLMGAYRGPRCGPEVDADQGPPAVNGVRRYHHPPLSPETQGASSMPTAGLSPRLWTRRTAAFFWIRLMAGKILASSWLNRRWTRV